MIYGFTLYDFIDFFSDDDALCAIYDSRTETEVFHGSMRSAKLSHYADYELQGVDFCEYDGKNGGVWFIFDIETDEDEEEEYEYDDESEDDE